MYPRGIDISKWDGGDPDNPKTLDWSAYTYPFVIIKVSEGTWEDPIFKLHWHGARGRTLRGGYHFFRPKYDPKQSAINTVRFLGQDLGELPMALDLEVTDGMSDVLGRAKSWLAWYEELTGVRPLIYSRTSFIQDELHCELYPYLANYAMWIAEYHYDELKPLTLRMKTIEDILNGIEPITVPKPPAPFKRVSFYQWTAQGRPDDVPGYYTGSDGKKEIDSNFYNGDLAALLKEFDIDVETLPQPEEGEPMSTEPYYEIASTNPSESRIIRRAPVKNSISNDIGKLLANRTGKARIDDVFVYQTKLLEGPAVRAQVGDTWYHLFEANGVPIDGWIAGIHLGVKYTNAEMIGEIVPPPPPPPPTTPPPTPSTHVLEVFVDGILKSRTEF